MTACKASNGSYWALQSWQTALPDLGLAPWLGQQKTWWLHLSHWTGELAKLNVYTDWIYGGRFQEVFGQYTYQGKGIRGFGTTRVGAPTDGYGRLLFLDTLQLVLRAGLAARELVRLARAARNVLLRLLRAEPVGRRLRPSALDPEPQARARHRRAVPDHRSRGPA